MMWHTTLTTYKTRSPILMATRKMYKPVKLNCTRSYHKSNIQIIIRLCCLSGIRFVMSIFIRQHCEWVQRVVVVGIWFACVCVPCCFRWIEYVCVVGLAECCAIFDKHSKRNARRVLFASRVSRDPNFQLYPRESCSVRKIAHLIRLAVVYIEYGARTICEKRWWAAWLLAGNVINFNFGSRIIFFILVRRVAHNNLRTAGDLFWNVVGERTYFRIKVRMGKRERTEWWVLLRVTFIVATHTSSSYRLIRGKASRLCCYFLK